MLDWLEIMSAAIVLLILMTALNPHVGALLGGTGNADRHSHGRRVSGNDRLRPRSGIQHHLDIEIERSDIIESFAANRRPCFADIMLTRLRNAKGLPRGRLGTHCK